MELPALAVTALPVLPYETAFPFVNLDAEALSTQPLLRLDDAIALIPGASLYRRTSSRSAHPTTQGLSLRQIGGNAAGRALVLLDGVPQNDPFGGWINWSALPPLLVGQAELKSGGGSVTAGPGALTGVLTVHSSSPTAPDALEAGWGEDGLWYAYGGASVQPGAGSLMPDSSSLQIAGGQSSDPGYYLVPEGERGPVDTRSGVDSQMLRGVLRQQVGELSLSLSAGWFDEERSNDTRLENNTTTGRELALRAVSQSWEALAYWQNREFTSRFSSVSDDRSSEQLVLDQYAVPSETFGGAARKRLELRDVLVELGIDGRRVSGENNELARNLGDGFTRRRSAGGDSLVAGAYLMAGRTSGRATFSAVARADVWTHEDGFYREYDRATGDLLGGQTYPDCDGTVLTGRLGGEYRLREGLSLVGAVYRSFRVPTLNELYRPFRVGDVITLQNPSLDPETLLGIDAGLRWREGERLDAQLTLFAVRLNDAISNVTIAQGPGNFDPGGYVPEGGALRQRQNVGAIETYGLEASSTYALRHDLDLTLRLLLTHSRLRDAGTLSGLRPAQTPQYSGSLSARWLPTDALSIVGTLRGAGNAFEDDLNTLRLDPYAALDAAVHWQLGEGFRLSLNGRNLADEQIQTGRDPSGAFTIGEPRTLWAELRYTF